jgi:hypothetical protein
MTDEDDIDISFKIRFLRFLPIIEGRTAKYKLTIKNTGKVDIPPNKIWYTIHGSGGLPLGGWKEFEVPRLKYDEKIEIVGNFRPDNSGKCALTISEESFDISKIRPMIKGKFFHHSFPFRVYSVYELLLLFFAGLAAIGAISHFFL